MNLVMENEMIHKYEYEIDFNDHSAPARVVRMVGHRKRVLEIGAGPGSITRLLTGLNGCRVTALEIDPAAIEKLGPFCERVYRVDLNDSSWPKTIHHEGKYEVVVVADVLEHLYDPWSSLKLMKGLVGEGGCVVVSLPHVGHSALLACLLGEDFEYRDWGLLDKTHIRFFGIKNIQSLFDSAGLKIVDAQFVVCSPEETEFAHHWARLPASVRSALSSNRFGDVYQVVIKAIPSETAGQGVRLADLPVEKPPVRSDVAFLSLGRVRNKLKSWGRIFLGPELCFRLRRLAARTGIRI